MGRVGESGGAAGFVFFARGSDEARQCGWFVCVGDARSFWKAHWQRNCNYNVGAQHTISVPGLWMYLECFAK